MKKTLMIMLMILTIVLGTTGKVHAQNDIGLVKVGKSAILMEASTGTILYSKEPDLRRPPASMTKIMTLKLILDAVESKRIDLEEMVTTSEYASKQIGTRIFLSVNEQMKVKDLIKSIAIASANDASVALAERISGSEENFVAMMNKEASRLGLKNTNFVNCTGLPAHNHYSSSRDMAIMARELILKHENILEITKIYEDYVREDTPEKRFWLVNTNKLVRFVPGVDGLKTGWTEEAGYCLTATMKKNGMRVISVIMGEPTTSIRSNETMAMLNYAFSNFETKVLIPKGTVVDSITDITITPYHQDIVTSCDINVVIPKGENLKEFRYETKIDYDRIKNFYNRNIGTLDVYYDNELYAKIELNLEKPIQKTSFLDLLFLIFQEIFLNT
ncbi:MAG: D-alanyl-D-alanine carboxypeptidase family protein [Bacilli bacterium]|jgi:D-alanyl-D-alanine carboxypeptidase (penicillin-binding protein 5/6)|nr:D-alanyl-D-alanine carboxypeptidase [Acholeplasmataceae bacterium]